MVAHDMIKSGVENWEIDTNQEKNSYGRHKSCRGLVFSVGLHPAKLAPMTKGTSSQQSGCISFSRAPLLWSAVAERSGDTALDFAVALGNSEEAQITLIQSGVAPLFPLAAALHIKQPLAAAS